MARSMKEVHTINYYPINEGAARRAKEMNSFSDYKEGSATAEYRAMVDKAAAIFDLSVRPRPRAATPALRPGGDRSLPGGRSWRTGRMARYRTECIRLPYTAPGSPIGLSLSRCGAQHGKGNTRHSIPGSAQVKIQDRDNQLCFQPAAQFFIHIGIRAAMSIIACPGGKRSYVTGIVADYHIYRVRFTPDSGGDYRIRKQGRPCACRFNHLHHLPSAPSATDRLFACGH